MSDKVRDVNQEMKVALEFRWNHLNDLTKNDALEIIKAFQLLRIAEILQNIQDHGIIAYPEA